MRSSETRRGIWAILKISPAGVRFPAQNCLRWYTRRALMSKRYVLCLTAANRTGILAAVATALSELGGDIHQISHTTVANFFALILTANFPDNRDPEVITS